MTATLNEEQRARLGVDLRPYIEGKSAVVATFTGNGGKIQNAKVDANLTSARLSSPELDWAKPEDAKASMKAMVVFKPDGSVEINDIDAVGQGLKAQGRLVVAGGRIREADFKRLQLGERNDFAILHKIAADGSRDHRRQGPRDGRRRLPWQRGRRRGREAEGRRNAKRRSRSKQISISPTCKATSGLPA